MKEHVTLHLKSEKGKEYRDANSSGMKKVTRIRAPRPHGISALKLGLTEDFSSQNN